MDISCHIRRGVNQLELTDRLYHAYEYLIERQNRVIDRCMESDPFGPEMRRHLNEVVSLLERRDEAMDDVVLALDDYEFQEYRADIEALRHQ